MFILRLGGRIADCGKMAVHVWRRFELQQFENWLDGVNQERTRTAVAIAGAVSEAQARDAAAKLKKLRWRKGSGGTDSHYLYRSAILIQLRKACTMTSEVR